MGRPNGLMIRLKDGSGTTTRKYLTQETDRYGNTKIYFRKHGKRIRMKSEVGTEEFLAEYRALFNGNTPATSAKAPSVATNSLTWLVEQYYQSAEFRTELSERTQYVRRGILEAICKRDGHRFYREMEAKNVRFLRDSKADVPATANSWVKALRQLFAWAVEAHDLAKNPAKDVPYIRTGGDGFHAWTPEEVKRYEERHPIGTMARLALDLMLYTGVRRSDAVRLGPKMESSDSQTLRFTVTKGERYHKRDLELPILPSLRRSIDATKSGGDTYLVHAYGRPFKNTSFGNWFRDRCNEAGLTNCSAHGLRKAGATLASEHGATAHQLKAIFGWSSIKEAEHYTKRADQARLAKGAMHLLERSKTK